jgi:class 3 adenylate cyclase/tetratricopeptide (TPR) repeat protein
MRALTILLFGLYAQILWGQSLADSLRHALTTSPADTNRVMTLVDYAWEINETLTKEAEAHLQEALQLSRRLGFARGEAYALSGMGTIEDINGNIDLAEAYHKQSLAIRRTLGNPRDVAASLNNLGVISEWRDDYVSALKYHRESYNIMQDFGDSLRMARAQENIAGVYLELGDYPEAQTALNQARRIYELQHLDASGVYTKMGHLHLELDRYEEALTWYDSTMRLRERGDNPLGVAQAYIDYGNALDELNASREAIGYYHKALDICTQYDDALCKAKIYSNIADAFKHIGAYPDALRHLERAERIYKDHAYQTGLMEIYNTWGDVLRRMKRLDAAFRYTNTYYRIALDMGDKKYIQRAYKDFSALYASDGNYKKAYEFRVKYDEYRYAKLDENMTRRFAYGEVLYSDQFVRDSLKDAQIRTKMQADEIAKRTLRSQLFLACALGLGVITLLLYNRNRIRRKANQQLTAQNEVIRQERERADQLLLNILPASTATELKANNRVQPVRYEEVTVLFTDFVGFTTIAETMTPEALVDELDRCFRHFDALAAAFNLEKIKTIGDAYMCAGGLPEPNVSHAVDTVGAALAMLAELDMLMEENKAKGNPVFSMRIGIHTGPVVAGVVGTRKFAYDIWGDAVNTAARMEQSGLPGKVNISESTWLRVKHRFECTFRGKIQAKNKGELAMFFVERPLPGEMQTGA